jgi:hypothetical protein
MENNVISQKANTETDLFSSFPWTDIKEYAKSAGVNPKLNKDDLCKALAEKEPLFIKENV